MTKLSRGIPLAKGAFLFLVVSLLSGCSSPKTLQKESLRAQSMADRIVNANADGCADDAEPLCGFHVIIVDDHEPNAFLSLQHNRIRITSGMLDVVQHEDELAFIVAHELAHVDLGHGPSFLSGQRMKEWDADMRAVELLVAAGYDADAGVRLLNRIATAFGQRLHGISHPSYKARAERLAKHPLVKASGSESRI
jgi:predicted Zn-dependent protease